MLNTAAENGIELVQIDYTKPLGPQGPFSAIIHKLRPNKGELEQPGAAVHLRPLQLFAAHYTVLLQAMHFQVRTRTSFLQARGVEWQWQG